MEWIKKISNKGKKVKMRNIDKCTLWNKWNITHEEGREVIQQWREKRLHLRVARKSYHEFLIHWFSIDTLKSFLQNINFMVVIQMFMAIIAVYIFQIFKISFDVHVSLFVSPIVFPLAFSINTDFQRREKVLEDLAAFKSSGMAWYFCMREWQQPAGLDTAWITAAHGKLKSLLYHLREYLLTDKIEHRKIILRAMYEDFSDANQLTEKVRASKLPANTAIVSRSIHLLYTMCLSFERLRVIREYRSPRSIRSFNKVLIMFLPIILAPYFVYLGIKSNNVWEPYYIAVLVAFVFSALQGAQDKLDNPFDGMSEDDINLDTIDEWIFASLEHTMERSFDVGRFKVTVDPKNDTKEARSPKCRVENDTSNHLPNQYKASTFTVPLLKPDRCRASTFTAPLRKHLNDCVNLKDEAVDYQKLAPMLEGMKGNTRITRQSIYRKSSEITEDISEYDNRDRLETIFEPITITKVEDICRQSEERGRKAVFPDKDIISSDTEAFLPCLCQESNKSDALQIPQICVNEKPFDSRSEQEYRQDSSKTNYNIPLVVSMYDNGISISDSYIDRKESYTEADISKSLLDDSTNSCVRGNVTCGKRFCIKNNNTMNSQEMISKFDDVRRNNENTCSHFADDKFSPKEKSNVFSGEFSDLNLIKDESQCDNIQGVCNVIKNIEKSRRKEVNNLYLDNVKLSLSNYTNAISVAEDQQPLPQTSEDRISSPVIFADDMHINSTEG